MSNILTYKGFTGSVNYSSEQEVYYGKIEGICNLVTFEGERKRLKKLWKIILKANYRKKERS